ncbi:MAG: RNA polymerase-binding protein DksA [Rickettsiales bacterium]|jgi:DnaK suppressor protein|nr:RNA polymerase-binding protein DksA [Rickettsiales bacterium]
MASKNYKTLALDPKYIPKKSEEYMSVEQRAYFYQLLTAQKEELIQESDSVLNAVRLAEKADADGVGDDADNSSASMDAEKSLKMARRRDGILRKIDAALDRLEKGTFGYSVLSGEEIGISRLLARPLATLTIEEKEEEERRE